jgi:hypothetical protein
MAAHSWSRGRPLIEVTDAVSTGWAVGYYLVPGGPDDVIEILGPPNNPFFSG